MRTLYLVSDLGIEIPLNDTNFEEAEAEILQEELEDKHNRKAEWDRNYETRT